VDGAVIRYNTIYHPRAWAARVLQGETGPRGWSPAATDRFEHNLIVFRADQFRTPSTSARARSREFSVQGQSMVLRRPPRPTAAPHLPTAGARRGLRLRPGDDAREDGTPVTAPGGAGQAIWG
jgi:hypothetical protein